MSTMSSRRSSTSHLHRDNNELMHYKITVMGAAGVGKTSIISRFLYDRFVNEYQETIEELYREECEINGRKLMLDILDTSGAHAFPAMRKLAIANSNAFMLVYSFDDMSSFEEVKTLREQILAEKSNDGVPIVVVANKCDMSTEARQVERKTTETMVEVEWGNGYVEVSAKEGVNIVRIFTEILRQCISQKDLNVAVRRRTMSTPAVAHKSDKIEKAKRHSCTIS